MQHLRFTTVCGNRRTVMNVSELVLHLLQVVMTTIEPRGGGKARSYDAFEYIAHSHTYMSDNQPTAKVTYDLSPIQVGDCVEGLTDVMTDLVLLVVLYIWSKNFMQDAGTDDCMAAGILTGPVKATWL